MPKRKTSPGRPKKPAGKRRESIVHVRLTEAEHAKLRRRADQEGRSMSNLLRILAFGQ